MMPASEGHDPLVVLPPWRFAAQLRRRVRGWPRTLVRAAGEFLLGALPMSLETLLGLKPPKIDLGTPPSRADPAVEEARRRALIAEGKTRGPAANYLTGGRDLGPASVSQKYLTGQ